MEQLRPGQEGAIRAAAAGRDALAVLPTDAGKSAIDEGAYLKAEDVADDQSHGSTGWETGFDR